jgi:hypothetical protein
MKVLITKTIGMSSLTFEVEAEKELDALAKASFYTTAPDKCGSCGSTDVMLESNKAESFTFVKIRCNKCRATANMGQFKDGSGGFWKKFEAYVPTEGKPTTSNRSSRDLSIEDYSA